MKTRNMAVVHIPAVSVGNTQPYVDCRQTCLQQHWPLTGLAMMMMMMKPMNELLLLMTVFGKPTTLPISKADDTQSGNSNW